jgi:Zn-dependent peptidase ImmA (M78 family)/DNA-binding XRE family transcriptional regulator
MFSQRIKQLRLARGMSLEALSAEMGGVVSKQALQKYEKGKARPSPTVLVRLAAALGVKAAYLWAEPTVQVQFVGFRKRSRLPKREQERVESVIARTLEQRIRLQELTHQLPTSDVPVHAWPIKKAEDAEEAAERLRAQWSLGVDPISSVTDLLEGRFVHVVEIDADAKFDGTSAVAYEDNQVRAAAVVTRRGLPGERQRLDIAHELGHLVMDVANREDEEKVAFRFGGAFLAPAELIRREVGERRVAIEIGELLLLKKRYGMSLQALLHRLYDLGIINQSYYRTWCIQINQLGWKKHEPGQLKPEQPQWLQRNVLHALTEGTISKEDAEEMTGHELPLDLPLSLVQRRSFMKLPLEERRRILGEQAQRLASYYRQNYSSIALEEADLDETFSS